MKRVLACVAVAAATLSMIGGASRAQPAGDDDDGAGSGSNKLPVAPKDPKARDTWLADKLGAALTSRPKLGKTKIGVQVVDLSTTPPRVLFAHDAQAQRNLASTTKLLTSTAALATLGPGFRWRTAVYADALPDKAGVVKGDLYLRGRGDPLLSERDLRALADEVVAHGVAQLDGKLVVDDTYFDRVTEPPHYNEQKQERAGFRAPVAALGVARSAVTVIVTATPADPTKASIRLEPDAGDYVKIVKRAVTTAGSDGRSRIQVDAKPKGDHLELEISGTIRALDGSFEQRKRIDDPARFAAEVFRRALAERGVRVKKIATGVVPTAAKLIGAHDGATLASALRDMNKYSDNYIAESVLKTLGAEARALAGKPGPATWADGTAAVSAYLQTLGLAPGSYRADNGSGLFDASRVTPAQLVTVLAAAHADYRVGPDLVASLPIGGLDGTLAKRWHGHPAAGRVRAKTGTLDKVTALAGYAGVDGGHLLAFAILFDDMPGGVRPIAREAADDMIDALVAYLAAP